MSKSRKGSEEARSFPFRLDYCAQSSSSMTKSLEEKDFFLRMRPLRPRAPRLPSALAFSPPGPFVRPDFNLR